MVRRLTYFLVLVLAALAVRAGNATSALEESGNRGAPLRVLLIGNSFIFYNDMPNMLRAIAANDFGARPLEIETVTHGGWSLQRHWESGEALRAIQSRKWDYVVLQDYSTNPVINRAGMFAAAQRFDEAIDATGAKTTLLLTWAQEKKPQQQSLISDAYRTLARKLDALVAPVGEAWAKVRGTLNVKLHASDGRHPSPAGSYLEACVLYQSLTGRSAAGMPLRIRSVPVLQAQALSDAADETVSTTRLVAAAE